MDIAQQLKCNRDYMKRSFIDDDQFDLIDTDYKKGLLPPPIEKAYDEDTSTIIQLPDPQQITLIESNIFN